MLFNSIPFAILLAVTFALYYLPGLRALQVYTLTLASCVFYAYEEPLLLLLLLASIGINVVASYFVAVGRPSRRRFWAVLGVSLNLAMLLFFKYSPLLARSLPGGTESGLGHFLLTIPLPIGISFFTFQGISLMVEVFRNQQDPTSGKLHQPLQLVHGSFLEHLRNTALFKSFFPNLVAGPIVKAHEFYPQIVPKRLGDIAWETAFRALVVGYFLKMVVADNLKDTTFWLQYPFFLHDSPLCLAALLFGYSMQIFADFAGYSLIAIGLAFLFGYRLPQNFDFPYIARSFSEFWRRWHISLSTWLRDYLYLPLGGNRRGPVRTYVNLFIVMFLGGLWHGAAWSYAIWGTFHGLALAAERFCKQWVRLPRHWFIDGLRILAVFTFVSLAWLLFKLPHFQDALAFLGALLHSHTRTDYHKVGAIVTFSAPVILYYAWHLLRPRLPALARRGEFLLFGAMIAGIVLNSGSPQKFIYFQF